MSDAVAIIGVGTTAYLPTSPHVSYKEMTFEAASKAYADAGIEWNEVESFVSCAEDFLEGTSIFDEYCPDQMGGAKKPVHTISGDGIFGIASAVMLIRSGLFNIVAVEAHSKVSNIENLDSILTYADDPFTHRPLHVTPHYQAGLEMRRFLHDSKNTEAQCAAVVTQNCRQALKNPLAAHAGNIDTKHILRSRPLAAPLKEMEKSRDVDGGLVVVLASEKVAKRKGCRPVWVKGIGWSSDSFTLESRTLGQAVYAADAAKRAYTMAGVKRPGVEIQVAEIDDTYAYKELQHLESIGLSSKGRNGKLNVNTSGGSLGQGHLLEAAGLARVRELVLQLRGEAGPRQIDGAKLGLGLSWRGVPTSSGAVIILGSKK